MGPTNGFSIHVISRIIGWWAITYFWGANNHEPFFEQFPSHPAMKTIEVLTARNSQNLGAGAASSRQNLSAAGGTQRLLCLEGDGISMDCLNYSSWSDCLYGYDGLIPKLSKWLSHIPTCSPIFDNRYCKWNSVFGLIIRVWSCDFEKDPVPVSVKLPLSPLPTPIHHRS
jgi:hypothetical protein